MWIVYLLLGERMNEEELTKDLWGYTSVKWLLWYANRNFDPDWDCRSLMFVVRNLLDNGCNKPMIVIRLAIKVRREQIRSGLKDITSKYRCIEEIEDPYPGLLAEDMDENQLLYSVEVLFDTAARRNAVNVISQLFERAEVALR